MERGPHIFCRRIWLLWTWRASRVRLLLRSCRALCLNWKQILLANAVSQKDGIPTWTGIDKEHGGWISYEQHTPWKHISDHFLAPHFFHRIFFTIWTGHFPATNPVVNSLSANYRYTWRSQISLVLDIWICRLISWSVCHGTFSRSN